MHTCALHSVVEVEGNPVARYVVLAIFSSPHLSTMKSFLLIVSRIVSVAHVYIVRDVSPSPHSAWTSPPPSLPPRHTEQNEDVGIQYYMYTCIYVVTPRVHDVQQVLCCFMTAQLCLVISRSCACV